MTFFEYPKMDTTLYSIQKWNRVMQDTKGQPPASFQGDPVETSQR